MIRLTVPSIDDADLDAVRDVVASGHLVQAAHVAEFERLVAGRAGTAHAVAVSNCTAALHVALLALGVGPGDVVAVSAYSWPASANAVELCGARPAFVDVRADTFNMDPAALARVLDGLAAGPDAGRVKAVLVVHAFGQVAEMPAILETAARHGLPVVEDAACAIGATHDGRPAGAWGTLACFSFHPRKAVTTGEGGAVTANDAALVRTLRALRNHGLDPDAPAPDFIMPGFNYRLTEFQGALGCTQMAKLDRIVAARRAGAARYDAMLAGSVVQAPARPEGNCPVYQSYVVTLPEAAAARRAEIVASLRAQGIETTIGTWHIPVTTYYATRYGYRAGDFPGTDAAFARAMTLPLHETLGEAEQRRVVDALLAAVAG